MNNKNEIDEILSTIYNPTDSKAYILSYISDKKEQNVSIYALGSIEDKETITSGIIATLINDYIKKYNYGEAEIKEKIIDVINCSFSMSNLYSEENKEEKD